jgi:hypothetical protein
MWAKIQRNEHRNTSMLLKYIFRRSNMDKNMHSFLINYEGGFSFSFIYDAQKK